MRTSILLLAFLAAACDAQLPDTRPGCSNSADEDASTEPVDAQAGVDASGAADARAPQDSGRPDGGSLADVGTPDVGALPDVGTPDVGTPDIGASPDVGTPDVGTPDVGALPDVGTADSGRHIIDGKNDFKPTETFATTSTSPNLYQGYISWDDTNIFFGMSGVDVGSGSSSKWVLIYLDGPQGTTTGLPYNGVQQPQLPFSAAYHLRWKADNSYTNSQKWNGSAWVDSTASIPISVAQLGQFMEMSISRASIGSPTSLKVHVCMLIEGGGKDWTYAGVPSTSFKDGLNPNFTKYFQFDLNDFATAPNSYAPLPP